MSPRTSSAPAVAVAAASFPGSRTEELQRVVAESLHRNGFRLRFVPLHRLPESALMTGRADAAQIAWTRRLLIGSAGVVLITSCHEAPLSRLAQAWLELVPPGDRVVQPVCLGASRAQRSGADYAVRRSLGERGARRIAPASFVHEKSFAPADPGWRLDSAAVPEFAEFRRELTPARPAA